MAIITCVRCGNLYPKNTDPFICDCGGYFDYQEFPIYVHRDDNRLGVWSYFGSVDQADRSSIVSLGEGGTPLLPIQLEDQQLWLKMESLNPTGSYKDRGTTTLVSHLKERGISYAVEDSSGNAGASFAAYCAKGSIRCKVFVPESASGPKRTQIEMFGAELVRVPGPRSEAAKAVINEVKTGVVYGSHAFMPFGLPGIATIAYEIVEQLGEVPGRIIAPVGHGGLLYGIMRGFESMESSGFLTKQPFYIGVQSENCAPITRGFESRKLTPEVISAGETIAEGVKVANPVRGEAILSRMQHGKGIMVKVSEVDLQQAYQQLARLGIYCEPTSALAWAGAKFVNIEKHTPTVAVITGSGYKSSQNLTGIV